MTWTHSPDGTTFMTWTRISSETFNAKSTTKSEDEMHIELYLQHVQNFLKSRRNAMPNSKFSVKFKTVK